MALEQVGAALVATGADQVTRSLARMDQAIRALTQDTERLGTSFQGIRTDQMEQAATRSSSALSGLGASLRRVAEIAGGILVSQVFSRIADGIGRMTQAAVGFGKESILYTARIEELDAVLDLIGQRAGFTGGELDGMVKDIKGLGITTDVAQKALIQFSRYGLDMAQAIDLVSVAQDAAVIGMQDSSEALDGLMHGITTMNTRVLRTYGITLSGVVDRQKAYAEELGISFDEMNESQKMQAVLNAVLAEGEKISGAYETAMELAGKQLRSFPRYIKEIQENLGGPFQEAFATVIFRIADFLKGLGAATEEGQPLRLILEDIAEALNRYLAAALDVAGSAFQGFLEWIDRNRETISRLVAVFQVMIATIGEFGQRLAPLLFQRLPRLGEVFERVIMPAIERVMNAIVTFFHALNEGDSILKAVTETLLQIIPPEFHQRIVDAQITFFNVFQTIRQFVTENRDAIIGALKAIGGAFAIYLGGRAVFGTIRALGGLFLGLVGLITNPIFLVIAAIALLGAAFATDFMGIRTAFEGLWKTVKPIFDALVGYFGLVVTEGDPLNDWLTHLPEAWQGPIRSIGEFIAAIIPLVRYIAFVIAEGDALNDWLTHLPESWQGPVRSIGEFIAAIGPLLRYLGLVITEGDELNDWLTHLPDAWQAPVRAIGGFIVGLMNVFRSIFDVFGMFIGEIREGEGPLDALRNVLGKIIPPELWPQFQNLFDAIQDLIDAGSRLVRAFAGLGDDVGLEFGKIVEFLVQYVIPGVAAAIGLVVGIVGDMIQIIANLLDFSATIWERYGSDIVRGLSAAFQTIAGIVVAVMNFILGVISAVMSAVSGDWRQAWEDIKLAFIGIISGLLGAAQGFFDALAESWAGTFDLLRIIVEVMMERVIEATIGPLLQLLAQWVEIWNAARTIVSSIWDGIISGVRLKVDELIETVIGGLADLWTNVKDFLGMSSPSKLFEEAGAGIMEGIALGAEGASGEAAKDVNDSLASIFEGLDIPDLDVLGMSLGSLDFDDDAVVGHTRGFKGFGQAAEEAGSSVDDLMASLGVSYSQGMDFAAGEVSSGTGEMVTSFDDSMRQIVEIVQAAAVQMAEAFRTVVAQMNEMTQVSIPAMTAQVAAPVMNAPSTVQAAAGASQTDNWNMTINTAAQAEQVAGSYEMMRARAGRRRI